MWCTCEGQASLKRLSLFLFYFCFLYIFLSNLTLPSHRAHVKSRTYLKVLDLTASCNFTNHPVFIQCKWLEKAAPPATLNARLKLLAGGKFCQKATLCCHFLASCEWSSPLNLKSAALWNSSKGEKKWIFWTGKLFQDLRILDKYVNVCICKHNCIVASNIKMYNCRIQNVIASISTDLSSALYLTIKHTHMVRLNRRWSSKTDSVALF